MALAAVCSRGPTPLTGTLMGGYGDDLFHLLLARVLRAGLTGRRRPPLTTRAAAEDPAAMAAHGSDSRVS